MSNHYNVLMPREYTTKDGAVKTSFTKVGVAFPMKEKDGFQVTLEAIPLQQINSMGKLECKLLLLPPMEDTTQVPVSKKPLKDELSDAIPF